MVHIQQTNIVQENEKNRQKMAKMTKNGQKRHRNPMIVGQRRLTLAS